MPQVPIDFLRMNSNGNFDAEKFYLSASSKVRREVYRKGQQGNDQSENSYRYNAEGMPGGDVEPDPTLPDSAAKHRNNIILRNYESKATMAKLGANGPRRGSRYLFYVGNYKGNKVMSRLKLAGNLEPPRYGWGSYRAQQ